MTAEDCNAVTNENEDLLPFDARATIHRLWKNGYIYDEKDSGEFNSAVKHINAVKGFFANVEIEVLVDAQNYLVFLHEPEEKDSGLPNLITKRKLKARQSIALILLRESYLDAEREGKTPTITEQELSEQIEPFVVYSGGKSKDDKAIKGLIEELKKRDLLLKRHESFRINPLIKHLVNADNIEHIKEAFVLAAQGEDFDTAAQVDKTINNQENDDAQGMLEL